MIYVVRPHDGVLEPSTAEEGNNTIAIDAPPRLQLVV